MEQGKNAETQYEAAEKHAHEELLAYIRNDLFSNSEVILVTELTSRLVLSMDYLGFSQVKDSTKKHLRRKLGTELAGSIHILSDDKGRLLLYCLTMSVLAKATYSLKMELQHARAMKAGSGFSDALLGMHAFTGWDTVSAFAGRGKIGCLEATDKSDKAYQEAFSELGRSWDVSDELFEKLQ